MHSGSEQDREGPFSWGFLGVTQMALEGSAPGNAFNVL